jgi:hypothetical protein
MGIENPWASDPTAVVQSPIFHSSGQVESFTVTAITVVLPSSASAIAQMDALEDASYPNCKATTTRTAELSGLQSSIQNFPSASLSPFVVTVTSNGSTKGVRSVTESTSFTVQNLQAGGMATFTQNVVHLQRGPVIVQLTVGQSYVGTGSPPPFPSSLRDRLAGILSARLGSAGLSP